MKKYIILSSIFLAILTTRPIQSNTLECNRAVTITPAQYCGNLYGGFTWLRLKSMPSDGDLQTGTLITLTLPPNLFARLQQLKSKPSNAFRAHLGYNLPCSNNNIEVNYFHYKGKDNAEIKNVAINQIIQSFLGGAYGTLYSDEKQEIHMANAIFGKEYMINNCVTVHPYLGVTGGKIARDMNVTFTNLIDSPPQVTLSLLTGAEKSKYRGIGPVVGADFALPLFTSMSLQGSCEGGFLAGKIKSRINALETNTNNNVTTSTPFNAAACKTRLVPFIKSQLAVGFHPTIKTLNLDCDINVGYEIDYYFNAVDRINPFDGFVVNENSFPVKQSSHLGLGGPFVNITLTEGDGCYYNCAETCLKQNDNCFGTIYAGFTSSWFKPVSDNNDLVYATLNSSSGTKRNQQTSFNHSWNGTYHLGFQTTNNYDFHGSFFHLADKSSDQITAKSGETISSVNASGNAAVVYSAAESKVAYNINQGELLMGTWINPACNFNVLLSCGVRAAALKRTINNQYTGGVPAIAFETKTNTLKSTFRGAGPVFALYPEYCLRNNLQLVGAFSTSLLIGHIKSTLDQVNEGTGPSSSNTLRMPKTRWTVPVVDAHAGLRYQTCLLSGINTHVEAGYQFAGYFKAIDQIYPVFLTGLQQTNSDLKLHGPYLNIMCKFMY